MSTNLGSKTAGVKDDEAKVEVGRVALLGTVWV
jgi:hypothetical protein